MTNPLTRPGEAVQSVVLVYPTSNVGGQGFRLDADSPRAGCVR